MRNQFEIAIDNAVNEAVKGLLNELTRQVENAEYDLLKNEDPHDQINSAYCDGIRQAFLRVNKILNS